MKNVTRLPICLLIVGTCLPVWSINGDALAQAGEPRRSRLREAVEAHRASQREEVRREEAAAGRRLTAEERAELREQLRQQWLARPGVTHTAESQPAERIVPAPAQSLGRPASFAPNGLRP